MQDSKRYNEWMNIVDYETPEGEQEHEVYKKELQGRGLTPAQFLARKRKASRQAAGTGKAQLGEVCPAALTSDEVYLMFCDHILSLDVGRHREGPAR